MQRQLQRFTGIPQQRYNLSQVLGRNLAHHQRVFVAFDNDASHFRRQAVMRPAPPGNHLLVGADAKERDLLTGIGIGQEQRRRSRSREKVVTVAGQATGKAHRAHRTIPSIQRQDDELLTRHDQGIGQRHHQAAVEQHPIRRITLSSLDPSDFHDEDIVRRNSIATKLANQRWLRRIMGGAGRCQRAHQALKKGIL
jgi:hypothetical protein